MGAVSGLDDSARPTDASPPTGSAGGVRCGGFRPAAICAIKPSGSVSASSPHTAGSGSPSGVNPSSASASSSSSQS